MDATARLKAIEEIRQVKAKYCRGVDTKDMKLLESIFAPDFVCDARGSATDPATGINAVPDATDNVIRGREAVLTAFNAGINSFVSAHHVHMPEITITGDTTAEALWPMVDTLKFPQGPVARLDGYGHYRETYEKIDGAWKIKTMVLTRLRVDATTA